MNATPDEPTGAPEADMGSLRRALALYLCGTGTGFILGAGTVLMVPGYGVSLNAIVGTVLLVATAGLVRTHAHSHSRDGHTDYDDHDR